MKMLRAAALTTVLIGLVATMPTAGATSAPAHIEVAEARVDPFGWYHDTLFATVTDAAGDPVAGQTVWFLQKGALEHHPGLPSVPGPGGWFDPNDQVHHRVLCVGRTVADGTVRCRDGQYDDRRPVGFFNTPQGADETVIAYVEGTDPVVVGEARARRTLMHCAPLQPC